MSVLIRFCICLRVAVQQRQINDLVYMLESRNITRGSIITSGQFNSAILVKQMYSVSLNSACYR